MAVLGGRTSNTLLGDLIRLDAESIGRMRTVLSAAGLLNAAEFRHEAVQAAVLGGMSPDERTALHLRAAELLHSRGAPAAAVADHLVTADGATAPWAVTALREAAGQAMAEGEVTGAIGYLRLAFQDCDDDERAMIQLALARAEWQIDPATAGRHLSELTRRLREGMLPAATASTLIGWLLWLGRTDEALDVMIEPARRKAKGRLAGDTLFQRDAGPWWLPFAYPGLISPDALADALQASDEPDSHASQASPHTPSALSSLAALAALPAPLSPPLPASLLGSLSGSLSRSLSVRLGDMLASALTPGRQDETIARAERILHESDLTLRTMAPTAAMGAMAAMATLIYSDEVDRAAHWVDLLGRSAAQSPPLGNALFTALRALLRMRVGELAAAHKSAHEAFEIMPARGWGVVFGLPAATMLLSLVAMGKYDMAENHLDVPVPEAMFQTPCVLPYLQARGRYYLAVNRPQAALAEFRTCGELMTRWGLDLPGFVPWRTDLAQAHLALGNRDDAKSLAAEQLSRIAPGQLRTRGITLRTLAATLDIEPRVEKLDEAVDVLEKSGDRLELAYALADLSDAYRVSGREHRANSLGQRARMLGTECGAAHVGTRRSPRLVEVKGRRADLESASLTTLSEAERRVATLAANGYTNRQIANRLHVTMSTVEQHLTRVYRKLNISRRTDLPPKLLLLSRR
ncbi:MAG TPA: LuxR C-terminal-related transcriptional regulator [Streptosporangiaceae bacterium]|nr:LuxR C-terminal-related transcriptional regulator [Streptosporangiaceae bacterium]